jgi:hypothetical protein
VPLVKPTRKRIVTGAAGAAESAVSPGARAAIHGDARCEAPGAPVSPHERSSVADPLRPRWSHPVHPAAGRTALRSPPGPCGRGPVVAPAPPARLAGTVTTRSTTAPCSSWGAKVGWGAARDTRDHDLGRRDVLIAVEASRRGVRLWPGSPGATEARDPSDRATPPTPTSVPVPRAGLSSHSLSGLGRRLPRVVLALAFRRRMGEGRDARPVGISYLLESWRVSAAVRQHGCG